MNVLIVEDAPVRVKKLIRFIPDSQCVHVSKGEQAVEILGKETFDLVFLDFDLAGTLNGLDVARAIRQLGHRPVVVVHAMNIAGASQIARVLPDAIRCPFRDLEARTQEILVNLFGGTLGTRRAKRNPLENLRKREDRVRRGGSDGLGSSLSDLPQDYGGGV